MCGVCGCGESKIVEAMEAAAARAILQEPATVGAGDVRVLFSTGSAHCETQGRCRRSTRGAVGSPAIDVGAGLTQSIAAGHAIIRILR